ncbi:TetM/TetW/TetO/TetS family tetracycline resistance ribosomal protection protein [Kribbella sp. NBC_01245]|uniref:translation factor GTPase family protein n=1 Tax=Kribbella sp. NBC_01245 TaxID=2903578 RepID=UPI002E2E4B04|nr:translation factor GTPase family protein [Kribbella sp. NBC_01245]
MGILAHVDAGKTSLTERLLWQAGVIDTVGRVDDGSTQTDSMDLERQRGITIRSAVVSFPLGDLTVNLIDTPGHSDFIAEVERALRVLDGAVLVISAVEGVQAQTRLLMRTLMRLRIPTLLFVNKIDRVGARYDDLLESIAAKLTPTAVPMGSVTDLGTRVASYQPFAPGNEKWVDRVREALAENDDSWLQAYISGSSPVAAFDGLVDQTRRALVHPVYFGSAITGEGVPELAEGIRTFLPAASAQPADGALQGEVFKIERGPAGERIAYARLFEGALAVRDRVSLFDGPTSYDGKVSRLQVFESGKAVPVDRAEAGRIAKIWGLGEVRIGDQLGRYDERAGAISFPPPTLETSVRAADPSDRVRLFTALQKLAEQDPLIRLRVNGHEVSVCLYGEVQKEVLKALLLGDFNVAATFEQTRPILQERPIGIGEAVRFMGEPGNLCIATVGLRIEPGAGVGYQLEVELGGLPRAFHTAIEETVHSYLRRGGLHGWEVSECLVTVTHTGYSSVASTAGDFRRLVPEVLHLALERAGTQLCQPMNHFGLEIPADTLAPVLAKLAENAAIVQETTVTPTSAHLTGLIPAARTHTFETHLPALTQGEALLTTTHHTHHPLPH